MKIQNHVYLLHGFEHGIVYLVRLDAAIRVRRDASGI